MAFAAACALAQWYRSAPHPPDDVLAAYASKPFGYDDLSLIGILSKARSNNARDGITGCLVCREDLYLQLLEGPRDAVIATFVLVLSIMRACSQLT